MQPFFGHGFGGKASDEGELLPFVDADGLEEVFLGEEKVAGGVVWGNAAFVRPEEAEFAAIYLGTEGLPGDLGEEGPGDSAAGEGDGKRAIFVADELNPLFGNGGR